MSILSKIAKKYKSLRFLNKKATKLCILGTALVGLCISSNYSFAKYRDENYGGGNAGAAKFEHGIITYTPTTIKQPQTQENIKEGYHLFACEFQYEVPISEVSFSYSIKLRLVARGVNSFTIEDSGLNKTSFSCNEESDKFYAFYDNGTDDASTIETSVNAITNEQETYSPNHWFYAKGDSRNNLDWNKSDDFIDANKEIVLLDEGNVKAGNSLNIYFVVLVFVYAEVHNVGNSSKDKEWSAESSTLLYSIDAVQEEV